MVFGEMGEEGGVNGIEVQRGEKFDVRKFWFSEMNFVHKPGATPGEINAGLRGIRAKLEEEMLATVPIKNRRGHVFFYVKAPKPPSQGKIGWEYRP